MTAALGVLDGGAEDRHESVAEKLVYDAVMFVDDVDHKVEQRIQISHHRLRLLAGCVAAEITNIEEHHADVAQFAPSSTGWWSNFSAICGETYWPKIRTARSRS